MQFIFHLVIWFRVVGHLTFDLLKVKSSSLIWLSAQGAPCRPLRKCPRSRHGLQKSWNSLPGSGQSGGQSPGRGQSRYAWFVENLKAVVKLTKKGSAFCHHHVPVILNNVSHKLLSILGQLLLYFNQESTFYSVWCFRRDGEGQLLLKSLTVWDPLGKRTSGIKC